MGAVLLAAVCGCSSSSNSLADARNIGGIDSRASDATPGDARGIDAVVEHLDGPSIDSASADATVQDPDAAPAGFCGDGHVDSGEQCDDGNSNDFDACSNACIAVGPVTVASISSAGALGNSACAVAINLSISRDGRFVVFDS